MAEERKPKIDLKARLQKTQGIPAQTPALNPGGPADMGSPASVPAPAVLMPLRSAPASIPAPSLSGVGGAAQEALGGLARGVSTGPFRAQAEPPPPPQPQRIEMDESTVHAARKGAFKTAFVAAIGVSALFGVLGYVVGGARTNAAGRDQGARDAANLADGVAKAKVTLETLKTKSEAARDALLREGKFPDALITELGALNVDFNGGQLAGRRFSGFKFETTQNLIGFVTAVEAINEKKDVVGRMLTRLQKPLTERLQNAVVGKVTVSHVVVLGEKDPGGNAMAFLSQLSTPISLEKGKFDLPKDFAFIDPITKKNTSLEKYTGGPLTKPSAVYVVPKSLEGSFPNEASSGASQLGAQLSGLIADIKGDDMGNAEAVTNDAKQGLLEKAAKLEAQLRAIK